MSIMQGVDTGYPYLWAFVHESPNEWSTWLHTLSAGANVLLHSTNNSFCWLFKSYAIFSERQKKKKPHTQLKWQNRIINTSCKNILQINSVNTCLGNPWVNIKLESRHNGIVVKRKVFWSFLKKNIFSR